MDPAADYVNQLERGLLNRQQEGRRWGEAEDNRAEELARLVSKPNPSAEEFVPSFRSRHSLAASWISACEPASVALTDAVDVSGSGLPPPRRKNKYRQTRRISERIERAQEEDCIKREPSMFLMLISMSLKSSLPRYSAAAEK